MKIFINPGHCPGVDPGAVNRATGITEAEICADVARFTALKLENVGHEVKTLQSDNLAGEGFGENVTATANAWGADIFISLHCNAFNTKARGTEIYTSKGQTNADYLATYIMQHVSETFRSALTLRADWSDGDVDKEAGLIVLNHTAMPAVLFEMVFIDNNEDLKILLERSEDFADAIVKGVENYRRIILKEGM